ncbi:hypothetical protein A0H76_2798 [Hepatospora eriocheir]|uniref:Uncharacterized protein n=1 Tax=Hepatospora eriocheir TaxID=1081669 RepID=A0A1X0QF42_9MICR|nr:hypothetical protein A0H76_2798 [Hepatospora eriocheir]
MILAYVENMLPEHERQNSDTLKYIELLMNQQDQVVVDSCEMIVMCYLCHFHSNESAHQDDSVTNNFIINTPISSSFIYIYDSVVELVLPKVFKKSESCITDRFWMFKQRFNMENFKRSFEIINFVFDENNYCEYSTNSPLYHVINLKFIYMSINKNQCFRIVARYINLIKTEYDKGFKIDEVSVMIFKKSLLELTPIKEKKYVEFINIFIEMLEKSFILFYEIRKNNSDTDSRMGSKQKEMIALLFHFKSVYKMYLNNTEYEKNFVVSILTNFITFFTAMSNRIIDYKYLNLYEKYLQLGLID